GQPEQTAQRDGRDQQQRDDRDQQGPRQDLALQGPPQWAIDVPTAALTSLSRLVLCRGVRRSCHVHGPRPGRDAWSSPNTADEPVPSYRRLTVTPTTPGVSSDAAECHRLAHT